MSPEPLAAPTAPPAGPSALNTADQRTLAALFGHPIAHSLSWSEISALFGAIGAVDEKPNGEMSFHIGGEHHLMRKPHAKELSVHEVLELRHFAKRAGWSPDHQPRPDAVIGADESNFLIVIDHQGAKIYRIDVLSHDVEKHALHPHEKHHHVPAKNLSRGRDHETAVDAAFHERIVEAVMTGAKIVLIGHGAGKSNAADELMAYLGNHHHGLSRRIIRAAVADLGHVTEPQLLEIGREALRYTKSE